MEQLSKRVDEHGKKIENHDERIVKLERESERTIESVKTLWNNDKELKKCLEKLTSAIDEQTKMYLRLTNTIDKVDARLEREERETIKRNSFKDSIVTKIVMGILATLGAGLCVLTLMGVVEWIRQIK